MFCALDLHRRNINRAISDNMLPEIGMYHFYAVFNFRNYV
jgi:hypothetical protein